MDEFNPNCFQCVKVNNLKAIHNCPDISIPLDAIVFIESNSQHIKLICFVLFDCFQCVKVNNLKAIHNQLRIIFILSLIVFSVSKLII